MLAHHLRPRRLLANLVVLSVLAAVALLSSQANSVVAVEASAAEIGPSSRALWVWDTSTPAETVALAQAQGIDQLYAAVPPQVGSSPQLADLRELSSLAGDAGIRVDALGGDPGWVDNPSWVVTNWLRPALATGLFTGVHVDIEPYTTAAWRKKRATVVAKYLATLDALRQAAGTTPLEADIPFWLHEVPAGTSTLDREIMARTDGVTVMAYRNTAAGLDGTVTLATPAVTAGNALGTPVRIGQETNALGTDPVQVKQTFFGQTRTAMEVQLAEVVTAFEGQPGFAGLALHDAAGYAAMAP